LCFWRRAIWNAAATRKPSARYGRNIEAALAWIDTYGDRDGDGFVEYYRVSDNG
jgi:hypothetical protein